MPSRRIYSETLAFAEVVAARTLGLLARYRLEVVLAVRPWQTAELGDVARALADAGVALSIWPMLRDEDGRWASVHNAAAFRDFTLAACDALAHPPRDVLIDLEPPFSRTQSLVDVGARRRAPGDIARILFQRSPAAPAATEVLARTVAEIHARGIATSLAVWPLVALDSATRHGWQSLLETPVDPLAAEHVSVMMYTTIFEGWSRGMVRRRDATALLHAGTARAVRRWGGRAGVSLGCVGTGAFEDEPVYRGPPELAEDVVAARAAGCDDLTLFDLGGVLARPPAEGWLDAFTAAGEGVHEEESARVRVARVAARAATWTLGRCTLRGR